MNILRIKKLIFLHLQHLPMKSRAWRPLVCKWGGVQIISPKRTFIGEGVIFDTNYPQDIFIEEGVRSVSVVTKDIPANEVWAGNPAKFIRKR